MFLYLSDNYFLYLFDDYLLDDLGNLDNLLDDSWHYNNLLDDPLNLHNFRYFHHFLNYSIDLNPHLFDPVNISRNLYDSLFNISDWFRHLNIMVYDSFNFNYFGLIYYHRISQVYFFNNLSLDILNKWYLYFFLHDFDNFMDNRYLNIFFHLFNNLSNERYNLLDNNLNRFNHFLFD